jgi:diguanylate cyclase (GGDEF)-like protein/PAS domain S-box-containing protein
MTGSAPMAFALPFVFAGLTVLAVGTSILLRERFSRVGWLHFLLSSTIGAWQLTTALEFVSADLEAATVWARLTTLFVLPIPALQYHFASVITGQWRRQQRGIAGAYLASTLLLAVHLAGQMQAGMLTYSWGYYPVYAGAGWVFAFFTVAVVVLCLRMYWQQYRGNRPGSFASRRGLLLFSGLSVASIGAIDFLPALGLGIFPLGGLAVMVGNIVNAYTTWRYRLVEITPTYAADQLMDSMSDGVVLIDRDGIVRLVNPAASEILGIDRTLLLNRLPPSQLAQDVLGWQHQPFFPSADAALGEREYVAADGSRRTLDTSVTLMREPGLEPAVAVITLRDITAAVQAQEQIERLAYYDPLTHLPNRVLLKQRLTEGMARARRARGLAAILFLDLDRFKEVNDTLGHDAGDMLLKGVAERISACIRETDVLLRSPELGGGTTLARLGGDEFVLVLSPLERPEDAAKVAARVLESLTRPFSLKHGAAVTTTASIGISVFPSDGEESDVLMKNADVAMYQAKENGRNAYHFHDESMNAAALARTDLENGLRRGLARNEFLLHYQPQIAARSGDIAGLDAQLFWRHPQHGMLPAAEFVAASEDATVVTPMSEWLVRSACLQLRAWNAMGLPSLYMSLTLPPGAAERGDLSRLVREASAQAGVDPGLLMLGFGSIPGTRVSLRTLDAMRALQDMGARLILDDLGNGPASFSSLGQYPLSMVRLEASFLRGLARDADLAAVTRAMIHMVHALNLGVVVTGVESAAHASLLRETGCDLAQGPAFGMPVAAEDVPALLSNVRQLLAAG